MKIVFDTNILIAAFISRGVCNELFEHCVCFHEIFISKFILTEFSENLINKFNFSKYEVNKAVQLLQSRLIIVTPKKLAENVSRDPKDDFILATAIQGKCQCIISGDEDLLILKQYKGIDIVSPQDFWRYEKNK
ncbi:MAG TPA: putative toxin-antitoxin system toxin component, PIN family [Candidatus Ratteibacteria bacterium]|nr:putative toxin-antitoxin system toxin component, PIN family [Candidatus Ratteibacteria bacterium]